MLHTLVEDIILRFAGAEARVDVTSEGLEILAIRNEKNRISSVISVRFIFHSPYPPYLSIESVEASVYFFKKEPLNIF